MKLERMDFWLLTFQQLAAVTDKYSGADVADLVRLAIADATDRIFSVSAAEYSIFIIS